MHLLTAFTKQLKAKQGLSSDQIEPAVERLASPAISDQEKAAFLSALHLKGESVSEIAGFAEAFRKRAIDPGVGHWAADAIDIVGTGGDHAGGFNISSVVILVLAAAGVPVMKHGNRGVTSKCGSADLLSGLGIAIDSTPARSREALRKLGFAFFFAPAYHPTFKQIAGARKLLAAEGQRSIFNLLGPLLNPGRPAQMLLGVFSEAWVPKLAEALESLGMAAAIAGHGRLAAGRGIDELTTASDNRVKGIGRLRAIDGDWRPEDYGLKRAHFDDLQGGDLAMNLAIVESLIGNQAPSGLVDTIVFNSAVAQWICGRVGKIEDGIEPSRELLLGGAVRQKLADAREFFGTDFN
jgi:anthranilate phosphoribosyltransferase